MARRPGGYKKADDVEWAECHKSLYGEAIVSANRLGQNLFTWINDAIAHHVYRVEQIDKQNLYRADYAAWMEGNAPGQPMQYDPKCHRQRRTANLRPGRTKHDRADLGHLGRRILARVRGLATVLAKGQRWPGLDLCQPGGCRSSLPGLVWPGAGTHDGKGVPGI